MSKHTPGPWNASFRGSVTIQGPTHRIDDGDYAIAFVSGWTDKADTAAEAESNARLIAAAPDLLEALQAYDNAMSSCWGSPDNLPEGNPDAARCWPLARAAIAKATGGEP